MGKYNSSLTRVQPIINNLYELDNTGKSWVKDLLKMATRDTTYYPKKEIIHDIECLTHKPQYEFPINPTVSFLSWLINNSDKLSNPDDKYWSMLSKDTRSNRKKLLYSDKESINFANNQIKRFGFQKNKWWILEGITNVDCVLRTKDYIILIEGKRTEIGPSKNIIWYKYRNQLIRNIECAFEYTHTNNIKDFYVLVIAERNVDNKDSLRQREIESVCYPNTVNDSLPHLSNERRKELIEHYLGVTYWEDIVEKFNLDKLFLLKN